MSKITFSLLFVFIFISGLKAQLIVTNTSTPAQLVQNNLVGPGVTVSNVTFNGAPANTVNPQIGLFDGTNTTLGMAEGILMTSGNVNAAVGPNNNGGISASMGGSAFDADLNSILFPWAIPLNLNFVSQVMNTLNMLDQVLTMLSGFSSVDRALRDHFPTVP
jgi:hypothetical protein